MEIDRAEEGSAAGNIATSPRRIIAPVDDEHPFDLDSYISNYSGKPLKDRMSWELNLSVGRTVIDRLIHIVFICPTIAPEAFQLCVQHIHQSRDPTLYQTLLQAYEHIASTEGVSLPNPLELAELDMKWADEVFAKTTAERVKLELELKTYSNNMIKESIRVCSLIFGIRYF